MTALALKQAALDHLAAENASACSLPLGDDVFVCVGTKEAIAGLVVPEGWKLVPIEPTQEMLQADWSVSMSDAHTETGVAECAWAAMLAATPPVDKDQS